MFSSIVRGAPKFCNEASTKVDVAEDQDNSIARMGIELGGIRTVLDVPMVKESELIGAFILSRQEVRPFTDKEIELVKYFAAQAVIAIENARLLKDVSEPKVIPEWRCGHGISLVMGYASA
jgi:GAF domain-containing protein